MVVVGICSRDRQELLVKMVDKFGEVGKVVVVDSSITPLNTLSNYYHLPNFTIAMARAYILNRYGHERLLMVDDNVVVSLEEVKKFIDCPISSDVAIETASYANLSFKDGEEEMEVVNPYKLYILNKINHNYDIHLPYGVFEDKQIGIDTWLSGKRVVKLPIRFSRKYGKGGVLGEDIRTTEKRKKYFDLSSSYFMWKYKFIQFSSDYRMLVGVNKLKKLVGEYDDLIEKTTKEALKLNEDSMYEAIYIPSFLNWGE